jgi:hypothetical protein
MALILVHATNAVRKVIFPATAAKMRVTLTRCSMVEEATANHTTVGTAVMVAMMHNMVFMMQLLLLKMPLSLPLRRWSISQSQQHAFARARKVVQVMLTSLNRCTILTHLKGLSTLLPMEEAASVARMGVEAVAVAVAVDAVVAAVDIATMEKMEAMEEISPRRTSPPLQQPPESQPLLLKATGLIRVMVVIAQLQRRPAGKHATQHWIPLPKTCTFRVSVAEDGMTGLCMSTARTRKQETK